MKILSERLLLLGTLFIPFSPVFAAQTECSFEADPTATYDLGVFAGYAKSPYRDWDGSESIVVPAVNVEYGRFYIEAAELGYVLSDCDSIDRVIRFDLIGKLETNGYDESDSDIFVDLEDRSDISFAIGFGASWDTQFGDLSLSLTRDVADTYEGVTGELRYELGWFNEDQRLIVLPYLGLNYDSSEYNNYYYGVSTDDARSFRASYNADDSLNPEIGTTVIYLLNRQSSLYFNLSFEDLDEEVSDSPLISEDEIVTLSLGYNFQIQ